MIKIEYEAGVELVELYIEPEDILYLKKINSSKGTATFLVRIKSCDNPIHIAEKTFNQILAIKQSLWRDKQINSILDD